MDQNGKEKTQHTVLMIFVLASSRIHRTARTIVNYSSSTLLLSAQRANRQQTDMSVRNEYNGVVFEFEELYTLVGCDQASFSPLPPLSITLQQQSNLTIYDFFIKLTPLFPHHKFKKMSIFIGGCWLGRCM